MELNEWRMDKVRSWKEVARFNHSNGTHLLAEQATKIADQYFNGEYDPPFGHECYTISVD